MSTSLKLKTRLGEAIYIKKKSLESQKKKEKGNGKGKKRNRKIKMRLGVTRCCKQTRYTRVSSFHLVLYALHDLNS